MKSPAILPRYRMYADGGDPGLAVGLGDAAGLVGSLADGLGPADQYGKKSLASNLLGSAGQMAAAGSAFGPIGTAVGAGVGLIKGVFANRQQKRDKADMIGRDMFNTWNTNARAGAARVGSDQSLVSGYAGAGYYAAGGQLSPGPSNISNLPTTNGATTPLSSSAAVFQGPSHAQGGIGIPGAQAEVEGGETASGDYIFSKKLGFADKHLPIARALGKVEQKVMSPERINTLQLLHHMTDNLRTSQEALKARLNLT